MAGPLAIVNYGKAPLGNGWLVFGTVVASAPGQPDEYIAASALGLAKIEHAVAFRKAGGGSTAANNGRCCVVLNARGTGVAEGTNLGDLGVEVQVGSHIAFMAWGESGKRS